MHPTWIKWWYISVVSFGSNDLTSRSYKNLLQNKTGLFSSETSTNTYTYISWVVGYALPAETSLLTKNNVASQAMSFMTSVLWNLLAWTLRSCPRVCVVTTTFWLCVATTHGSLSLTLWRQEKLQKSLNLYSQNSSVLIAISRRSIVIST